MEIFELINNILIEKKVSKREFAQKLIALEPKSNRTGEIISENIIYSYLSGKTAIKAYLIPYISDVLGVSEQFLFSENEQTRMKIIKHLCKNLSEKEKSYLLNAIDSDGSIDSANEVLSLIQYAPKPLLTKILTSLKSIEKISKSF